MNGKKLIFLTCALVPAMEPAGGPDDIAKAQPILCCVHGAMWKWGRTTLHCGYVISHSSTVYCSYTAIFANYDAQQLA